MAATPNVPNIQQSPPNPGNPHQPPPRVVENAPANSVAAALANGQRQVDATK